VDQPAQSGNRSGEVARARNTGTIAASIAAVGGVLAASSCCLPVLPFIVAAGLGGSSAFFAAARPYMLSASVLLIVFGFYQARRAKKCHRKPSPIATLLLWFSAAMVAISILFPQVLANLAANWLAR
jgi:cytochrome bd-type quinol oxidase subunit 2